ncbi:MAG: NUDIX hydrolase, partial [Mesorhizobium sp.]
MEGMTKADVDKLDKGLAVHGGRPLRPRDAATLILLDRRASDVLVLMGRRHAGHAFMPGKIVFPGGRTDPADSRVPVAAPLHREEEARLVSGPGRASAARVRAIAM